MLSKSKLILNIYNKNFIIYKIVLYANKSGIKTYIQTMYIQIYIYVCMYIIFLNYKPFLLN